MKYKFSYIYLIFLVSIITFLPHLMGWGVFVGDSDRMNHSLTVLAAFVKGFYDHKLLLWNDTVFGGYSLVALPYDYPNPIMLLAAIFGVKNIYIFAGFEAFFLFYFAGLFAYLYLIELGRSSLAACVGAILYQTSSLSLLKVSQNDMSFIVIVLIPLLMMLVRRSARRICVQDYLLLFIVIVTLFNFAFLQKVAYVGLLAVTYTVWLAYRLRTIRPLLIGFLAVFPASIMTIPRLITIFSDFGQSTRHHSYDANNFDKVYESIGFSKVEILRWFDERIFGSTFESMAQLGNSFNLSEGFLLFSTSFGPFIICYVVLKLIPLRRKDNDTIFFICLLVLTILLVITKTGYWILWKLFFEIDFIHFRILVISIFPFCALMSLFIDYFRRENESFEVTWYYNAKVIGLVIFSASLMILIEIMSNLISGKSFQLPIIDSRRFLDLGGLFRIIASFLLFFLLCHLSSRKSYFSYIKYIFATMLVTQATLFSAISVWGHEHWPTITSFKSPTRLMAKSDEFKSPSLEARTALRSRLETDYYRTSFVCPPEEVAIFCSTQIANFWELRSIDGYVSTLPKRLADLPWDPNVISLRAISHLSTSMLNWPLLGLFNVKYALAFRPELFTNAVREIGQSVRELKPDDVEIIQNPLPVTPRIFFARKVKAVSNEAEALEFLFPFHKIDSKGYDVEEYSVAEGLPGDLNLQTGSLAAKFKKDLISVEVSPASEEQFLILNERYDPNWEVVANESRQLKIFPTNIAMQGVLLPPFTYHLTFSYRPFMIRKEAFALYCTGILISVLFTISIWLLSNKIWFQTRIAAHFNEA